MKVIVDISEEDYRECKFRKDLLSLGGYPADLTFNMRMETTIANGTLLPEGHGDLIDRSKLLIELECGIRAGNYEEGYEKYPHINDMDDCFDTVKYADTIIEADKENK